MTATKVKIPTTTLEEVLLSWIVRSVRTFAEDSHSSLSPEKTSAGLLCPTSNLTRSRRTGRNLVTRFQSLPHLSKASKAVWRPGEPRRNTSATSLLGSLRLTSRQLCKNRRLLADADVTRKLLASWRTPRLLRRTSKAQPAKSLMILMNPSDESGTSTPPRV